MERDWVEHSTFFCCYTIFLFLWDVKFSLILSLFVMHTCYSVLGEVTNKKSHISSLDQRVSREYNSFEWKDASLLISWVTYSDLSFSLHIYWAVTSWLAVTGCPPWAVPCGPGIYVHKSYIGWSSPIYRWGNWGSKSWADKVLKLMWSRAGHKLRNRYWTKPNQAHPQEASTESYVIAGRGDR